MSDESSDSSYTTRRNFLLKAGGGAVGFSGIFGGLLSLSNGDHPVEPNRSAGSEHSSGRDSDVKVVGHRGAAGLAPPNTMKSIETALEFNVDGVEIDIRKTSDGQLILFHDPVLNWATGASGIVEHTSYEEVSQTTIGGEPIPTIDTALERLSGSDVDVYFEVKSDGITEDILNKAGEYGVKDRSAIFSFEQQRLKPATQTDIPAGLLGKIPSAYLTQDAKTLGCTYAMPHYIPEALDRFVDSSTDHGIIPGVWSLVGTYWNISSAINAGVQVLTTNRPDIAVDVVSGEYERGSLLY